MGNDFVTANSSGLPEAVLGFIVVLAIAFILLFLVIVVLTLIINWKMLEKMGDEGWKAIVPVYNTWAICEGVGLCPHWGWIIAVAPMVGKMIPVLGSLLASAIVIYFSVIFCISIARSFGKSDSFAALLFFFYPIVGFILLRNEYVGKMACHDIVFDDWIKINKDKTSEATVVEEKPASTEENKQEENKVDNNAAASKFCSSCGSPLEDGAKFCTQCGNQVNS